MLQRVQQRGFAVEDAGAAREHAVFDTTLDPSDLQHGATLWRQVAGEQSQSTSFLVRFRHGVDDVSVRRGWIQPLHLLRQGLAGTREAASIQEAGVEQFLDDDLES